jgi:hypothetical protein
MVGGHKFYNDLYFSLDDIKRLPEIIRNLNHIEDIVISPFHITDESIMEAYWLKLSIKVVNNVQDKFIVLISETGKSSLEELDEEISELWDNTYYQVQRGNLNGFLFSIERYISFMKNIEADLIAQFNLPGKTNQAIYYQIY